MSYIIADSENKGKIKQDRNSNTQTDKPLSTSLKNADEGEKVTVTFYNFKNVVQNLTLRKQVPNSSGSNNESFNFNVEFENLASEANVKSTLGVWTADIEGKLSVDFEMSNNEEIVFYDLPVGTKYKVTESECDYLASYKIQDSNNGGNVLQSVGEHAETNKALSTQQETVDEDEEATITFTNEKVTRDISVKKLIDMTYGDAVHVDYKALEFTFNVTLNGLEPSATYRVDVSETDVLPKSVQYIDADSNGHAEGTIVLRHGQSFSLRNIPVNSTYQIREQAAENFVAMYKVDSNENAIVVNNSGENTAPNTSLSTAVETIDLNDYDVFFVFTNKYTATGYTLPESGMKDSRMMLYAAMLGFVIFAGLYFITNRKKQYNAHF